MDGRKLRFAFAAKYARPRQDNPDAPVPQPLHLIDCPKYALFRQVLRRVLLRLGQDPSLHQVLVKHAASTVVLGLLMRSNQIWLCVYLACHDLIRLTKVNNGAHHHSWTSGILKREPLVGVAKENTMLGGVIHRKLMANPSFPCVGVVLEKRHFACGSSAAHVAAG